MFDGYFALTTKEYVIATLVMTHITIAGVTIFLHRCQAHRALDLHPVVSHFFRFWLWLTTGIVTKHWVAIHRKHHAKVETPDDPHSPQVYGIWNLLFGGVRYYRQEANNAETVERYGHATPDDWLENNVYSPLTRWGYTSLLIIELFCWGWHAIPIWFTQMAWIPFWAAGVVNGIGHFWGYRNFETDGPDTSTNIFPWGIIIGGEELHNNHHSFSSSAKLSVKWWEFDIGWMYIRILSALGLATVKRTVPELPCVTAIKGELAGVRMLMRYHTKVLDRYRHQVLDPVFQGELAHASLVSARSSLKEMRSWLVRRANLLSDCKKKQVAQVLAGTESLKEVYELKNRLFDIYQQTHKTMEQLRDELQAWCEAALATDVTDLHEFAHWLRSYLEPKGA